MYWPYCCYQLPPDPILATGRGSTEHVRQRGTSGRSLSRRRIRFRADPASKDMQMISELCVLCLFPPYDCFFNFPRHVMWSLNPLSLVWGACSYLEAVREATIECSSSSFNTKLQRMYPVQVLRGAACCCKILPRLLPLLLVMQFCFEEVLGERNFILISFAVSLQTEASVVLWAGSPEYLKGGCLLCLFLSFCIEPDLWDYTDAWPGIWGSLSAGSAGSEDQTSPEPPSGTRFRCHWDQVQPTCAQTTRQCTEVSGELDLKRIVVQDTVYSAHMHADFMEEFIGHILMEMHMSQCRVEGRPRHSVRWKGQVYGGVRSAAVDVTHISWRQLRCLAPDCRNLHQNSENLIWAQRHGRHIFRFGWT